MRFTSAEFIFVQILLSLVIECMMVKGLPFPQPKKRSLRQQQGGSDNGLRSGYLYPTNRKKVVLMCHNLNYLVMINDKLKGSVDPKIIKRFGKFEMLSFGVGVVRIFNVRARKFIAVDKRGRAYVTRNNTVDSLFKETQKESLFVTYHSLVHRALGKSMRRKWYLAIRKNGRFKPPFRTFSRHRSIEFLQQDWGKYKLRLMMNSR